MIFIIGGNSQGKLEFAKKLLHVQDHNITNGAQCDVEDSFCKPVLNGLHLLIQRLHKKGLEPATFIKQGIEKNPNITIISDELSTGVIPTSREDRELQERIGRIQCMIAKEATHVYRVHCSIPTLIKGEQLCSITSS